MGHHARIDERDFENMNPTVIRWTFAIGSVKAVVHAILPDFYVSSTSDIVKEVQQHLQDAGCRNDDDVNKKIE